MSQEAKVDERFEIIKDIFRDVSFNKSKDEVLIFCPKHEHRKKKLSINVLKNKFQCWVCGYSGHVKKLLAEHARPTDRLRYLKTLGITEDQFLNTKEKSIELPKEYKFLFDSERTPQFEIVKNKLKKLGLTKRQIIQNKIGFCEDGPYAGRIIFPSFDKSGNINYFTTRRYDDIDYKKYLNCEKSKSSIIFNELFIDWKKPIIIVEGIKSSIKHLSIGNIVPILGSSINDNNKIFQEIILNSCNRVYVCLDPDAKDKAYEICNRLAKNGVETYLADCVRQPDELTTEEFVLSINESKKISIDDIFIQKIATA